MDDYLRQLIDAPLANATRINLPAGKRAPVRAVKAEETDDIGCQKLTPKQVRERKGKATSAKLETLFDYYAGTNLSDAKIAEHMGLYRNEQNGVDKVGKPIMVRVLDVKLVEQQMAFRRKAA